MPQIVFVNTDNLITDRPEAVEVHSPNCNHLKKYSRQVHFRDAIGEPEEFDSAQDFFDDYNSDFYAEQGDEGTWDIAFFPCSELVKKTTVISKMSY